MENNSKNETENEINTFKAVNFSRYWFDNWKKSIIFGNNNEVLNMIEEKCGAIWLNKNGALCYRFSKNEPIVITKNYKHAELIFSSFLDIPVSFLKIRGNGLTNVDIYHLLVVHGDKFQPQKLSEFFIEGKLFYRNLFKPTYYLQIKQEVHPKNIKLTPNYQEDTDTSFESIKRLIMHLVDYIPERFNYIINWLAYFFQALKKSQVALVLRGNQGTGKGIFFNEIIKPLFSAEYCKTINDKSLNSSYLGGIIENALFFNLDEISYKKVENKTIKNFLKALITNDTITAEKKFVTLEKETNLYAQVLITSNEPYVLDIEPSDRRYTIFNTSNTNLAHNNYLNYGSYHNLSTRIETQLESFAQYLKNYSVNVEKANEALDTNEKRELQMLHINVQEKKQKSKYSQAIKIHDSIIQFGYALKYCDVYAFRSIEFENLDLYNEIVKDLKNCKFKIKNLLPTFNYLYGDELKIKYVSILLKELNKYDFKQFSFACYRKDNNNDDFISLTAQYAFSRNNIISTEYQNSFYDTFNKVYKPTNNNY